MSITAMKQALEALEANQPVNYCMNNNGVKFPMMQEGPFRFERNTKAITALRAAIEQAEQARPVAWITAGQHTSSLRTHWEGCEAVHPECKAEQAQQYVMENAQGETGVGICKQAQPVAWMRPSWVNPNTRGWASDSFEAIPIEGWIPLYTAPPPRQPLTDDEIAKIAEKPQAFFVSYAHSFARAIEKAHNIK